MVFAILRSLLILWKRLCHSMPSSMEVQIANVKCCCGKSCKEVKSLKMHQRGCRIVEGLSEDQLGFENSNFDASSSLDDNHEVDHVDSGVIDFGATVQTKPSVYLPKTDD